MSIFKYSKRHISIIISILALNLIILNGCAGIKTNTTTEKTYSETVLKAELLQTIEAEMNLKNITGLSISVADSEGVIWAEGFGLADKKHRRPFDNETVSNIGSVSKIITATTVMRLVEMGKIDLDAPVSTYIEEFNPRGNEQTIEPITVRMLLNHQSGLESDAFHDFFLGYNPPQDYAHSYRRAVDAVNKSGVVREPYSIFSYCNLGYALLGCIIERVHGTGFQEAVAELVFEPTGMSSSSFVLPEIPEDRLAVGYVAGKALPQPYIRDMPAGSLNSSANDMGLFMKNILATYKDDTGLLKKATLLKMLTPSNTEVEDDLDFSIGLAWWILSLPDLPGEYIIGHGGDLPPYHAVLAVLPERDLSVFMMVNSVDGVGSFSLTDILTKTVRTFAAVKKQNRIQAPEAKSPVIAVPESAKNDLPGYYASGSGLSEIRLKGDKLKIFAFNRWFDLHYHEDGTMTMGMKILGIIPLNMPIFDEISISTEEISGKQSINLRLQGILISPCVKIEPVEIDHSWLNRSGTYSSINPETMPQYTDFRIQLDKDSGFLCLNVKSADGWSKYPLQTENPYSARLMGTGRGLGGTIIVHNNDNGEILQFQNFELIKD